MIDPERWKPASVYEICEVLGVASPAQAPGMMIEGVGPLDKALFNEMTFYRPGSGLNLMHTQSNLVLSRLDFANAAWKFFPPGPAVVRKDWSTCTLNIMPTAVIGGEAFAHEQGVAFPHYAGVTLDSNVWIGHHTCVDRGAFEDTFIGENTRVDNLVHVGHNVHIGKRCTIVAGTIFGGSSSVGDDTFIGMNATIRDHIKIGNGVTVGMGAVVLKDVPDGLTVVGNPARAIPGK